MDLNALSEEQIDSLLEAANAFNLKSPLDYIPHPANTRTGFPGMKEFHCSDKRVRIIFGGNQSGKTVSGVNEILFHATGLYPEWYPKSKRYTRAVKIRIVGEEYKNWGKVIEDKLLEWLPRELIIKTTKTLGHLTSLYIKHISTNQVSIIDILTHEQDVGVFESWTGDVVWFDEPPPQDIYSACIRGLMAQGGWAIFTMTPLKEPWLHNKFILDKDPYAQYWIVDMDDNPHLTPENKTFFISQMTDDEKDARIHGKFKHLVGRIYKEFDEQIHVVDEELVKVKRDWPVYFVCDPHDRKPHHGIWARISPTNTIYVVDEIQFTGTIKDFSKAVRVREALMKIRSDDVIRIGDPNKMKTPSAMNGLTFQQEFCGEDNPYKLYFNCEVNDDITLGHLAVKRLLMWNKDKPISSTNCPKLYFLKDHTTQCVKQLLTYIWSDWKGASKDEKGLKEVPKDINKDFPDCVRYLAMFNPKWYTNDSDAVYERPEGHTGYGYAESQDTNRGYDKIKFTRD